MKTRVFVPLRFVRFVLFVLLMMGGIGLGAGTIGGVVLPDEMTVGGEHLLLNGAGLRKKVIIKVYAGGLYLKEKSSDAASIIATDASMAVRLHFIYNGVTAKKLIEAWNEGFANAGNTAALQSHIDAFNALFTQEAKRGDVYEVIYMPGTGIEVTINGVSKGRVNGGLDFKIAVFSIWLGDKPADSGLKTGMLGS